MPGSERRRVGVVLLLGWFGLVALHLWLGREVTSPGTGPGDQWGYVGSARFLSGHPNTYVMPQFPYFTYGYAVVLAPLVRLFDDPYELFRAIKVLNAALAATTLPLLYLFGRCVLRAERVPALAAAAMGSLTWPLLRHPQMIIAESLVIPLVIAVVLACWLFLTDRPAWQRLLFAPSMVWLHVTHNRFAASLLVFFVLLAVAAVTRAVPRRLVVANAGLAIGALALAQVVRNAIVEARWVGGILTPQGPASDALEVLTDRHLLWEFLLNCVGQLWYLGASTFGLAFIGVGVVVHRVVGARGSRGELLRDPQRLTLLYVLGMAAAVLPAAAYFFIRVPQGSEGFVHGRHNESFVALWVAVAVTYLLAPTPLRRVRLAFVGALAATTVLSGILLSGRAGGDLRSLYTPLGSPGLTVFGNVGDIVVHRATVVALVSMTIAIGLTFVRVRPTILLPVAVLWTVGATAQSPLPHHLPAGWPVAERVDDLGVERAAMVAGYGTGVPTYYPYYVPHVGFVLWDGRGEAPEPFVFARLDAGLEDTGARVAAVDDAVRTPFGAPYRIALWVMPGDEQDRLDAAGELEPPGYPADSPP